MLFDNYCIALHFFKLSNNQFARDYGCLTLTLKNYYKKHKL